MNQTSPQTKPIDKYIPWMFVAFFGVVIAVNIVFVTLAVKTRPGIITEQSYEMGVAYNKTLAEAEKIEKLGWKGAITYENDTLRFTLADNTGNPLSGGTAKAKIMRPISDNYDQELTLTEKGNGIYEAPVTLPLEGLWEIRVYAHIGTQPYQTNTTITVK